MTRAAHRRQRLRKQIPPALRRELEGRIGEARAELERLGVDVPAVECLIVPAVRFTKSGAWLDLPEPPPHPLTSLLGRRYFPLDEPIGPPSVEELQAEMKRLTPTVPHEHVIATAHVTLAQRRMREQGRDPARERERPAWEAARILGVALAVLEHPTCTTLVGARACFDALDHAHPTGESWAERLQMRQDAEAAARQATLVKQRWERRKQSQKGGRHKAGKLLPQNELIRRALVYDADAVSAANTQWLNGPVRRRRLVEVLRLLEDEDVVSDLIHTVPRLALSTVEVDSDAKEVSFEYTDRSGRPPVKFRTLENLISRLCRTG